MLGRQLFLGEKGRQAKETRVSVERPLQIKVLLAEGSQGGHLRPFFDRPETGSKDATASIPNHVALVWKP